MSGDSRQSSLINADEFVTNIQHWRISVSNSIGSTRFRDATIWLRNLRTRLLTRVDD